MVRGFALNQDPVATRTVRGVRLTDHPAAVEARARVVTIIDSIPPEDLVQAIKRAPSLRGMMLGYIAEEMFLKFLRKNRAVSDLRQHDDHDRSMNKADVDFLIGGKRVSVQLKSIQTNSICFRSDLSILHASVQNDGSDKREVLLEDGEVVLTTNYRVGDYDVLAVPLFPFTGQWDFAYKLNRSCRRTTSAKYTANQQRQLLSTMEQITYPLTDHWSTDLESITKSI